MIKKIKKEQKLKSEVEELKSKCNELDNDNARYSRILSEIEYIFIKENPSTLRIKYSDLPFMVLRIKLEQDILRGYQRPEHNTIENQREIIRWLINPETAIQKSIEDFNIF